MNMADWTCFVCCLVFLCCLLKETQQNQIKFINEKAVLAHMIGLSSFALPNLQGKGIFKSLFLFLESFFSLIKI